MPDFDIPTLYLLTGWSSLIASGILMWLHEDRRSGGPSLALFAAGVFALGAGFVMFALRDGLPGAIGPIIGYAGFGLSAILFWVALAQLLGAPTESETRTRATIAAIAFGVYMAAQAIFHGQTAQDAMARIVLNSCFLGIFLSLSALHAQRSHWLEQLRAVRVMRNLMLGYAALVVVRMLAFLLHDIPLQADGSASPGLARLTFSVAFGSIPFAVTVTVLSVANSQLAVELRRQAATDDLTGLVARRSLRSSAERLLKDHPIDGCIALLMIDLDEFKSVNDRHGHAAGDTVLRHVAGILRERLRSDAVIVRYGGDEFCALVPVSDGAAAHVVAERLRSAIEASPCQVGGLSLPVTLSIGVSVHRMGVTLPEMIDEADRHAFHAKSSGRNRVVGNKDHAHATA